MFEDVLSKTSDFLWRLEVVARVWRFQLSVPMVPDPPGSGIRVIHQCLCASFPRPEGNSVRRAALDVWHWPDVSSVLGLLCERRECDDHVLWFRLWWSGKIERYLLVNMSWDRRDVDVRKLHQSWHEYNEITIFTRNLRRVCLITRDENIYWAIQEYYSFVMSINSGT